jgi:DDE superfamily endonuclease
MHREYQQVKLSSTETGQISKLFEKFKFDSLLEASQIVKVRGKSIPDMLFVMLIIILESSNSIYNGVVTNHCKSMKTPINDMLNNPNYNWRNFLYRIVKKFISLFFDAEHDTGSLIIDDTDKRKTGKKVQHLSWFYDHSDNSYFMGYQNITAAWSNGRTTIPVDFEFKKGKKKTKHSTRSNYPKKSPAEQRVRFAGEKKTVIAVRMIKRALKRAIPINYILWDSWYNCSSSLKYISELVEKKGIHLISMLKRGNNKYKYQGKYYDIKELSRFADMWEMDDETGIKSKSLIVEYLDVGSSPKVKDRSTVMKIKISFFKYPTCKKWKAILSTNLELTEDEVLKLYLQRWSIECLFKEIKQYFGYNQSKGSNYYAMVADLTIRYSFYIMFCSQREEKKQQSMMQILMGFYEELFDEWLTRFIEKKIKEGIRKFLAYALKQGTTDLRELNLNIDNMLVKFFEEEFYPDKIVEVDKPPKRKVG